MLDAYLKQSDRYMLSLYFCMDNAHAAEKMYDWANVGENNAAWQSGPYLSGGKGGVPIPRTQPYCLRTSDELGFVAGYQFGGTPKTPSNGGIPIGHESKRLKSTEIIPTVTINVQFSILEAYDHRLFKEYCAREAVPDDDRRAKRYNRRPVGSRLKSIEDLTGIPTEPSLENAYLSVSNYRNQLTHEPDWMCGCPVVAFDVYVTCQAIAFNLTKILGLECKEVGARHRISYWSRQMEKFEAGVKFT